MYCQLKRRTLLTYFNDWSGDDHALANLTTRNEEGCHWHSPKFVTFMHVFGTHDDVSFVIALAE